MNKPLTIEQLKALEVGDWVWLDFQYSLDRRRSGYYQIKANKERTKVILCGIEYDYLLCDYGTMWTAYKNKEQAENKDEDMIEQIEKAYEHNIAECERCMKKVDMKHQFAMESMKEHIRKDTAKVIYKKVEEFSNSPEYDLRDAYDCNALDAYNSVKEFIKRKYSVEVDE